jgi:hypothetical protein
MLDLAGICVRAALSLTKGLGESFEVGRAEPNSRWRQRSRTVSSVDVVARAELPEQHNGVGDRLPDSPPTRLRFRLCKQTGGGGECFW